LKDKRSTWNSFGFPTLALVDEFWIRVFNATFNNISVISWLSVLLVEKTGVLREI
jgi:hypothetical protein